MGTGSLKQRITNCAIFDGERMHRDRSVVIVGTTIVELATADRDSLGADAVIDLHGNLLAPGLVDLQVNGGGGVLFNDSPSVADLHSIGAAHRVFGTTSFLPTLISDDLQVMEQAITAVRAALDQKVPGVLGIHLEGPCLNPEFRGVHDAAKIRAIDDQTLALFTSLPGGCTLVTVAPERLCTDTIASLSRKGVIVFAGHSAASYEETCQALGAGLRGFTHLFNAMTPLQSRSPGMVGAALADQDSFFGIIADGHHVHPASLRVAIAAKPVGKAMLVSDAMPTVGTRDKSFILNGKTIHVENGRCVTADGTLAGSDLGMIEAVRNVIRFGGVDQLEALRMASAYPAHAIRLEDELGYIRPGYRANLIELDPKLKVVRSWIDGDLLEYS